MTNRSEDQPDPLTLKCRCPRLGQEIHFEYCMESGDDDFACWKVLDCWWEIFDVESYLKANLPASEFNRMIQMKPKPKVASLVELVEKAKRRTEREPDEKGDG